MSYLSHTGLVTFDYAVKETEVAIHDKLHKFDSVLCTGLSGITVASIICYMYSKHLVILRKPNEQSHGKWLEGNWLDENLDVRPYIIIDDFISGGLTLRRMLAVAPKDPPEYVVLYGRDVNHIVCPRTSENDEPVELSRVAPHRYQIVRPYNWTRKEDAA